MANGYIIIDKPEGITSHGVVSCVRRAYACKRVGHSGTLDPMATGVLPMFVGRATRACEFALCDDKTYEATLQWGISTDTQDITGRVLSASQIAVTEADMLDVLAGFTGTITQTPPMYSALKRGGVPLYALARAGVEVERERREVVVSRLEMTSFDPESRQCALVVSCGKGTYIRTLCDDIGKALGCGACMAGLRRTRAGIFDIADAVTLEQLAEAPQAHLRPLERMFEAYTRIAVSREQESIIRNGAAFPVSDVEDGTYRVCSHSGEFLMLGRAGHGIMNTIKSFFEV